jgi:hypothetical protein
MSAAQARQDKQRTDWQQRLLPLMSAMVLLAALFFAFMSVGEIRRLYERLEHPPMDMDGRLAVLEQTAGPEVTGSIDYLRMKMLGMLEAEAISRRYDAATATMLARVWTRQLGFITGMLLALVGAAFILGRLNDPLTRLEAGGSGLKGALETSSPGIVLAVLGSVLMGITIWIPFEVETRDLNIYLTGAAPVASTLPRVSVLPSIRTTDGNESPRDDEATLVEEANLFDR